MQLPCCSHFHLLPLVWWLLAGHVLQSKAVLLKLLNVVLETALMTYTNNKQVQEHQREHRYGCTPSVATVVETMVAKVASNIEDRVRPYSNVLRQYSLLCAGYVTTSWSFSFCPDSELHTALNHVITVLEWQSLTCCISSEITRDSTFPTLKSLD